MALNPMDVLIGDEIASVKRKMTFDQIKSELFSGRNPIHFDDEIAKKEGLPGAVFTGIQICGLLGEMLNNFFGIAWLKGGTMEITFIGVVLAGDTIEAKGIVKEKMMVTNGEKVTLDIWCEKQFGEKIIIGKAIGYFHRHKIEI